MVKKLAFVAVGALILSVFALTASCFAEVLEKNRREAHILYKIKSDASDEQKINAKEVLDQYGAETQRKLKHTDINLDKLKDKKAKTEEEICQELIATGAVEFAEPDYLEPPAVVPNDPSYGSQWFHPKINSPLAWDTVTGDPAVIVAVCDSGVEATHPDLADNLLLPGLNTVDGTTNTSPITNHGTSVAGCIGAIGNNAIGVSGVAWVIKILPVRISNLKSGSAYLSDMGEGITWAADQGAKVVNVSYGGADSYTIDSSAQYARDRGTLVFFAAGNDGAQVSYPDFASFVCVGATNSSDARTSWSNYGTAIDIVAPGENIYTTTTGGAYRYASGTSFSSPISAGLGALIYSINPSFTPAEVESFIFSTCVDLGTAGDDIVYGNGRINSAAAVQKAANYTGNVSPVAVASATPTEGNVPLQVAFDGSDSYDSDGSISRYAWSFGDGAAAYGEVVTHTYTQDGNFNASLTVTDNMGASSSDYTAITVYPDPNVIKAPTNLSGSVSKTTVTLRWTDNSTNEEGFYIERGIKIKATTNYQPVGHVGSNVTTYTETVASGTYYYRVQAYNLTTGKVSGYSNAIQVRTRAK